MQQNAETIRKQEGAEAAEKLLNGGELCAGEFAALLSAQSPDLSERLAAAAREKRRAVYGDEVFLRGLIECTNYCRNGCLYCGIRRGCPGVERYRLTREEILSCCAEGHSLGYRTFVLQGGEDPAMKPEETAETVRRIKESFPDCAVTLSLGEQPREVYQLWHDAGADRYLLRHETADPDHYARLHPEEMSFENRMRCLSDLREIGFQTGAGMMVGSPFQTEKELAEDLVFIRSFRPHMVGIGPFIPAKGTPFENEPAGTLEQTLFLLSIIRLIHPRVLLPATTALGTIHPRGRELGILAGANVIMPNLTPVRERKKYRLYDNKICVGDEAAACMACMKQRMESIGCSISVSRGDYQA